jgi:uncharacterized protein (DUF885 family)
MRMPVFVLTARWVSAVVIGLMLGACGGEQPSSATPTVTPVVQPASNATPAASLNALTEEYFERLLQLNPVMATDIGDARYNDQFPNTIGTQWLADSLALEQEFLGKLMSIDVDQLDDDARLTYDIFKYGREIEIAGYTFRSELLPLNQFSSEPMFFGQMGSGKSIQPFATVKDYDDFLKRIDGFAIWTDQAIVNMKAGVDGGIVQPKAVIEKTLPQLASFVVDDPQKSIFHGPIANFPATIDGKDRERLTKAYTKSIREVLVPAYKRLHDYMQKEYLPNARDKVGMSALPQGAAWYAYLVRRNTSTSLTPEQIHDIGLKEMARIQAEMERVKNLVGFKGDLKAFVATLRTDPQFYFKQPDELVTGYAALKTQVSEALPKLFDIAPKADFEVRAVEAFRERSAAAASYQTGTPDGKRPGIFYANTYDLPSRPRYMMEAIFLHEALPGHHMQLALQYELPELPRFRRFGGGTAYVEGWGLYAESLGRELGLYQDPYQYFGALTAEAWRAARLVVDTGMHAKGWTREQAMNYMRDNTAIGEADVVAEVERYIAIPGQALAYKIGQLKIRELRNRAEQKLGGRFNVRSFHRQVLQDGAMPLAVLEDKINRWMTVEK